MAIVVDLTCTHCSKPFSRRAAQHRQALTRGRAPYCSKRCVVASQMHSRVVEGMCAACQKPFSRSVQSGNDKGIACSKACAALVATRRNAKARRDGPGVKGLCACGNPKKTIAKRCAACLATERDALQDRTLGELRLQYGVYEFHAKVRGLARAAFAGAKACVACGYTLHVDICHVRAVAEFPPAATLREVNAPENLVALDKRCHWEFDHGYLARVDGQWVPIGR